LLYFGIVSSLSDTEIGIFGGLFHSTPIGSSLAVFHARNIVQPIFPYNRFEPENGLFSKGYVKAYQNTVRWNSTHIDKISTNDTTLGHTELQLNPDCIVGFSDA